MKFNVCPVHVPDATTCCPPRFHSSAHLTLKFIIKIYHDSHEEFLMFTCSLMWWFREMVPLKTLSGFNHNMFRSAEIPQLFQWGRCVDCCHIGALLPVWRATWTQWDLGRIRVLDTPEKEDLLSGQKIGRIRLTRDWFDPNWTELCFLLKKDLVEKSTAWFIDGPCL